MFFGIGFLEKLYRLGWGRVCCRNNSFYILLVFNNGDLFFICVAYLLSVG